VDFNFCGLFLHESDSLEIHDFYIQDAGFESDGYCGGNIWMERVRNSQIHDFTIYSYGERGGYGIKATGGLFNVAVFNGDIDLKGSAMWNGGLAGNMAIEYWSGNKGEWGNNLIYNCEINQQVSMDMRNAVTGDFGVRIYENVFMLKGKTSPIELSSDKVIVDHNYFEWLDEGGNAAFVDYKNLHYEGIRIHHNICNGLRNGFISMEAGVSDVKIYNNTLYYILTHNSEPTVFTFDKKNRGREYSNIVFANNIVQGYKTTFLIDTNAAALGNFVVKGNLYYNVEGMPDENTEDEAELRLSGDKPAPYFKPVGASSNVVDIPHGMDMGDNYSGSGPDAGAYEFESSLSFQPKAEGKKNRSVPRAFVSDRNTLIISVGMHEALSAARIRIIDMKGAKVHDQTHAGKSGVFTIANSSLPKGAYAFLLQTEMGWRHWTSIIE